MRETYERAVAAHQEGRYDEAELGYRELLEKTPDEAHPHYLYGALALERERYSLAYNHLSKAVELEGSNPSHCNELGRYHLLIFDFEAALKAYEQALQHDGENLEAHRGAGCAAMKLKRFELAERHFRHVLMLAPKDPFSHLQLGEAFLALERYDWALGAARSVANLEADHYEALILQGRVAMAQGNDREAEKLMREALKQDNDKSLAHRWLGELFLKTQRVQWAIGAFTTARKHAPRDYEAAWGLGYALLAAGRMNDAHHHFTAGYQLAPLLPEARLNFIDVSLRTGDFTTAYGQIFGLEDGREKFGRLACAAGAQGRVQEALEASCKETAVRLSAVLECQPQAVPSVPLEKSEPLEKPEQTEMPVVAESAQVDKSKGLTTMLSTLIEACKPSLYLEVGSFPSETLELVPPTAMALRVAGGAAELIARNVRVYDMASDTFFAQKAIHDALVNHPVEFCLIDGARDFAQLLRDFIHVEQFGHSDCVIAVSGQPALDGADASPSLLRMSLLFSALRPGLELSFHQQDGAGLCLVRGLDSNSRHLASAYEEIVREYEALEASALAKWGLSLESTDGLDASMFQKEGPST